MLRGAVSGPDLLVAESRSSLVDEADVRRAVENAGGRRA
jgi:hypothetical protein